MDMAMAAAQLQLSSARLKWVPEEHTRCLGRTSRISRGSGGHKTLLPLRAPSQPCHRILTRSSATGAAISSRAMSDFADLQARRFRDDLMIILDRDGFPDELRAQIADMCQPIFRRYAADYQGTVPPEPFFEMRKALEAASVERWQDVVCAAIGWARWNMAFDFRKWRGESQPEKTQDYKEDPSKPNDPKSKN